MGDAFALVRRVVVFLLGVLVILDAVRAHGGAIGELAIGMVMVGVLPIDTIATPWSHRDRPPPPH